MLIGYDKSGMNRLMTLPLSAGHIDMAISKNIKQKISGSFGIEYHYKGMKKNVKGEITGMTETHKKTKLEMKRSEEYAKQPRAHKRYK